MFIIDIDYFFRSNDKLIMINYDHSQYLYNSCQRIELKFTIKLHNLFRQVNVIVIYMYYTHNICHIRQIIFNRQYHSKLSKKRKLQIN